MNQNPKPITFKETQEYKELPHRIQWAIDNLVTAGIELKAEKEKLNKQIESLSNFQPVQELKKYTEKPNVWDKKDLNYYNYGYSAPKDVKPVISIEDLQKWLSQNEIIYKENLEICKNNLKVKDLAFSFLKKLGLEEKKYDYVSKRSKTRDWVTCNWVTELSSFFITTCDYDWNQKKEWVNKETTAINKYFEEQKKTEESIRQLKENELKEQEKIAFIIKLVEKYQFKFSVPIPSAGDVKQELIKKNKYLYLAHYLCKNRGDWNEGYYYAEKGLNYFVSQKTEEIKGIDDSAICENIQSYISDWGGDGRCFRDCEFSYDVLFGIVSANWADLYNDYSKLQEMSSEE